MTQKYRQLDLSRKPANQRPFYVNIGFHSVQRW